MRKLSLFAALLAGGLLFSGCVFMDHPVPQISEPAQIDCADSCGQYDMGHGWINGTLGTAGPQGYLRDNEEGEYWGAVKKMESPQVAGCVRWEVGGGGLVRVDTYQNGAGDEASGCPPYTYLCGWGVWPLASSSTLCEPETFWTNSTAQLCPGSNGDCDGPIGAFSGLPGATWYNYAAGSIENYINWIIVDKTPGTNPFEASQNIRRRPGFRCPACDGTVTQVTQAPPGKTVVCHVPPGNPANEHTIIVGNAAVPAHLAHGDYLGDCGGVTPPSGGYYVPKGNLAPEWTLGVGFSVDYCAYYLSDQMAFVDEYKSCYQGGCPFAGGSNDAIARIQDILARNPVDDGGLVTLSMTRLNAYGESVTLNPPFELKLKMDVNGGQPAFLFAANVNQSSFADVLRWVLNSTPDKKQLDLTGLSIELTSGDVLTGATLDAALPYELTLNHDRIAEMLTTFETKAGQARDLNARVAGR